MEASTVRRRPDGARDEKPTVGNDAPGARNNDGHDNDDADKSQKARRIGVLDVLRMLLGLFVLSAAMSWFVHGDSLLWGWKPWFSRIDAIHSWLVRRSRPLSPLPPSARSLSLSLFLSRSWAAADAGVQKGPVSFTDEQLMAFDGSDPAKPIYVGLNGSIYDVSAGKKTYGPGGSYHFFAGRDAARAFLTGCFDQDLTPDLRGVEEMYIPVDDQDQAAGMTKAHLKVRKERDMRLAKKKIRDGIDGWARVFRGDTGRPYFWVGSIKREEGWLEKLPKRELCQLAASGRPKRSEAEMVPKPKPYP
jgi:predicted heme/steroid binding protein